MSEGAVRSRRSADGPGPGDEPGETVVVGAGAVAEAVRSGLGARGTTTRPGSDGTWTDAVRRLVLVVPAGEFGPPAPDPDDVRRVVAAAVAHGAEHVVLVTSAAVHGAAPGRLVDDDDPVDPAASGLAADLATAEEAARGACGPVPFAVVRPAVLVGPGVDTVLTRHFEAPRLLTVRGGDRTWQLLHVEDLVAAVRVVLEQRLEGALTAGALRGGAPDTLDSETVAAVAGLRTVSLPAHTAFGVAERLHRVGVLPSPASDLALVVYPWTVTARRLHDAGWSPAWSSAAALEVLVDQVRGRVGVGGRRFGGRDAAALGAAGAAVAVVATAAVWRQARPRR
ncbi:NAD-dependent epimerase/dehydratase family protein [Cellulosimicrobium marinum]|uniref:NAD-dependent epimerase/dehydratase family protein n=1 Tax=Cellulosimicrobium marinum TaxID=1638992 RepID=UPI001E41594B|nr:NAD-dependent epimerase/dehydratase family protein [Cellulosimicrobium marinum]MCB7136616.1 NAD-dependent epimerase/dehydratase family protein [Cellulosimicrobium marinum]